MASNGPGNVSAAFDMLLEEMIREVGVVKDASHVAIDANDFDKATRLAAMAKAMDAFKTKVDALREEWTAVAANPASRSRREKLPPVETPRRQYTDRLPPGVRTPLEAFWIPVLAATAELGGAARADQVVQRVGAMLRSVLTEADLSPLPSNPSVARWQNGAHWVRFKLIDRGLLKKNSRRGIWEITEAGRQYLAKNGSAPGKAPVR